MTNRFLITACAAFLLSAVMIFMVTVFRNADGDAAHTSGTVEISEASPSWTIKGYEDKIGIFRGDSSTPEKTININPKSLPDEAQLLLEKGITVNSREELMLLIEDYIS